MHAQRLVSTGIAVMMITLCGCGSQVSTDTAPAAPAPARAPAPAPAPAPNPELASPKTAGGGKVVVEGEAPLAAQFAKCLDASALWKDFLAQKTGPAPVARCSIASTRTTDTKHYAEPGAYRGGDVEVSLRTAIAGRDHELKRKKVLPSVIKHGGDPQTAAFEKVEGELLSELAAQSAMQLMAADEKAASFVPAIAAVLANEKETPPVRASAALRIGDITPISSENSRLLVKYACRVLDTNREVSNACAQALSKSGTPGIDALKETFSDDTNTRTRAIEILGTIGAPAAPALAEALKDKSWLMYQAVLKEIAKLGAQAEAARPILLEDLKLKDAMVSEAAARTLGKLGRASASGMVSALDSDIAQSTKGALLQALGNMGADAREALPALEAFARKQKGYLAGAANGAIKKIQAAK
ncbi:MAG TPA: HEAT repeat domain-containing protein [Planctomycetota bacterium]|nr:HEAT repeat domain-containing protein [Planctomycetota bacterium]